MLALISLKILFLVISIIKFSLLPQHKITNGIGLSAEEHVSWYLKDDKNNREGQVNGINAALGPKVRELASTFY